MKVNRYALGISSILSYLRSVTLIEHLEGWYRMCMPYHTLRLVLQSMNIPSWGGDTHEENFCT